MKSRWLAGIAVVVALVVVNLTGQAALQVYFVDVEGGQATLVVAPSGQSLLIDSGFPGARDADRIVAAARDAGVDRIDYHLITHLHADHLGSTPTLVETLPVATFIDVGELVEPNSRSEGAYRAYARVRQAGRHVIARPGDRVPIEGLDVRIVIAGGAVVEQPVSGGGQTNPLCDGFTPLPRDESEDARSVGVVIGYGAFRMLDLGDLTWNKEHDLACPVNLIGSIDLYLATRHGLNGAGLPALVHALRPRVAVLNNGATKGASPEHFRTIVSAPGLEDVWQLHYSVARDGIPQLYETSPPGGPELNGPEPLIANLDETTAHHLKLTVHADGQFVLHNPRNGTSRRYAARP